MVNWSGVSGGRVDPWRLIPKERGLPQWGRAAAETGCSAGIYIL